MSYSKSKKKNVLVLSPTQSLNSYNAKLIFEISKSKGADFTSAFDIDRNQGGMQAEAKKHKVLSQVQEFA